MKLLERALFIGALLTFNIHAFAIEGLSVSVQCTNVVLSWPSTEGETYMIQYRPALDTTNDWQPLTSSLPADTGTNITYFVHTNIIQNPVNCGGSSPMMMASSQMALVVASTQTQVAIAMPADGSGSAVPIFLYPPGFDFSNFIIFDPMSGDTLQGDGYSMNSISLASSALDTPVPDGAGSGDGPTTETGFYKVARIGVHIVGATNFQNTLVSDTITVPFEAANEVGSLLDVVVRIDGTRYRGVSPMIAPGISQQIALDTSFLENGDHSVQVIASWSNPDVFDFNTYTLTRYSDPFTISVSNIIYFPEWDDEVGELGFAFYSFKSSCTNVDWQIDIYDVSNNLARTLTGHTVDGTVETNWDLVDLHGVLRTNDADSEFGSIITVYDAPVSKRTPKKVKPIKYPDHGQWAICYQDILGNISRSNQYWNVIYDFGGMAAQYGGAVSVFPTTGHPEYGQTFPIRFNYTNDPTPPTGSQIIADEYALMWLITNVANRNFFYLGHCDGEQISSISTSRVLAMNPKGHYFRYVFLDGCLGATGSWPATFGINFNTRVDLDYFQKHGMRPRTFMGYTCIVNYAQSGNYIDPDTGQPCFGIIPDRVMYFLSNYEFYWNYYYDVTWSLIYAQNDTPDVRPGWADGPDIAVYGYKSLYIDAYNKKADWGN